MLDLKTLEQTELPELNQPRAFHTSLILDFKLYVLGGQGIKEEVFGSIEGLNLQDKSGWNILVQGHKLVQRICASVVAIR